VYSTVRFSTHGSFHLADGFLQKMALLHTITHPSRLHDVKFCKRVNGKGDVLLVGAEDQKLSIYQISDDLESTDPPAVIAEMVGHANRVKAVETLSIALPESLKSKRTSTTIVCTISSDGKIFVYDMASLPEPSSSSSKIEIIPKAEYDTKGTRLTCVTVAEGDVTTESENGKRKRTATDEVGEDDENDNEAEDEEGWSFGAGEVEEEGDVEEGAEESASEDD
jgi:protein MAK11